MQNWPKINNTTYQRLLLSALPPTSLPLSACRLTSLRSATHWTMLSFVFVWAGSKRRVRRWTAVNDDRSQLRVYKAIVGLCAGPGSIPSHAQQQQRSLCPAVQENAHSHRHRTLFSSRSLSLCLPAEPALLSTDRPTAHAQAAPGRKKSTKNLPPSLPIGVGGGSDDKFYK